MPKSKVESKTKKPAGRQILAAQKRLEDVLSAAREADARIKRGEFLSSKDVAKLTKTLNRAIIGMPTLGTW